MSRGLLAREGLSERGLPPYQEFENCSKDTIVHQMDTVIHLCTGRARQSLADGEKLLVLTRGKELSDRQEGETVARHLEQ